MNQAELCKEKITGKIFVKSLLALSMGFSLNAYSYADTPTFSLFNAAGEQIGVASLDKRANAQAELRVSIDDNTYIGVGPINKRLHNYTKAMQGNRGKLSQQERKHLLVALTAQNSSSMTCDLDLYYGKVSGQCSNSAKEVFLVQ